MSLRARILRYLGAQERIMTNAEIAKALKAPASQVSSITNKLAKSRKLKRTRSRPRLYYVDSRFDPTSEFSR